MSIRNRPFIGTWQMNRTLVRHTPDCIVYINGFSKIASCATCNKSLDFQQYITQVSVDATTDPISSATVQLSVPAHATDVFSYDGNHILQPALEVVIFMRGYFPMKNFGGKGQDPSEAEGFNPDNVPVYPYYQVFRGVVTSVSHEYSGGFYSASLSCSNLIHFWQHLKLSVNGSVFGKRPLRSMVEPSLVGHKFTGSNPYAIIYTLVKVGFGAAFGVDFLFSQGTNIKAVDGDERQSLFAHAAQWWEQRWTEHSGNLRMYGIDGRIFNAFEQAYLGRWYDTRERSPTKTAFYATAKQVYTGMTGSNDFDPSVSSDLLKKTRDVGWDPFATAAAVYDTSGGQGTKFATEDVLRMQAFSLDIGKMGSVNMFETEYMSKLEIVEAVKTITGYEFFQDVDGDLVFKPPMYNMDTRDDPVYRIEDRDLISISETETEPEATMMKGTGSHFTNITGTGLDGWLGVGGVYVDYRLVAKYGYKEETFETNYLNDRHAIFVSAMNRLDLANAGIRSASITIPLRPELRPGYPVFIVGLDCFYYVKSMSHSFAFGGQCTTSIQGIAKRSKWLPPMAIAASGGLPTLADVRLDAPDEYPAMPILAYPQNILTQDSGVEEEAIDEGPPRVLGFPNVVLAMDPDKVNLDTVDLERGVISADSFLSIALNTGFLERGDEKNTFIIRTSNESAEMVTLAEVQQQWTDVSEALKAGDLEAVHSSSLGRILQAIEQRTGSIDVANPKGLINFLSLQTSLKSSFSPGTSIAGKYRYFSCSHPDANHQAPGNLFIDHEAGEVNTVHAGSPDEGYSRRVVVLDDASNGQGFRADIRDVTRGIKIASFSQKGGSNDMGFQTEIVSTADIRFVTFGPQVTRKKFRVSYVDNGRSKGWNFGLNGGDTKSAFGVLLRQNSDPDQSKTVAERFQAEYSRIHSAINTLVENLGVGGNSGVRRTQDLTDTVSKALDNYTRLPDGSANELSSGIFPRKSSPEAEGALTAYLANALWTYTNQVINAAKRSKGFEGDYEQFMGFRSDFIREYTDNAVQIPDSDPARAYFFADEYRETADWTPIFPVSDSGGYEVFGNFPYGRGVTIEKYSQLVQSTTTGSQEDSGTAAAAGSTTLVGTTGGSNASSLQAIEKFFVSYLMAEDSQLIFSSEVLTDDEKAAVLATFNTTDVGELDGAVETLLSQKTSQNAKIRNSPVTSFFRGQSILGDVAAKNLANLDVEGSVCVCKGVDASFFLQAFSEEYLGISDDPLQAFQENEAFIQSESWKASRDALSGRVLDIRHTNLAQEFTSRGNFASSISSDLGTLQRDLKPSVPIDPSGNKEGT